MTARILVLLRTGIKLRLQLFAGIFTSVFTILVLPAVGVETAPLQASLNSDGSGELLANRSGVQWSWEACSESAECSPFATGSHMSTNGAPTGTTTFRLNGSDGSKGVSPLWHGNVFSVSAPSVTGSLQANALVKPVLGNWSGGWTGDTHLTQLAVCKQSNGEGCTTLTDPSYAGGCPEGGAVIDPVFTGWYLQVADKVLGPAPVFGEAADTSPYGHEVWKATQIISTAIVGQIGPATGGRESTCGPPALERGSDPDNPNLPSNTVLMPSKDGSRGFTVRVTINRRGVVVVRCAHGCSIVVTARDLNRRVRVKRRLRRAGVTTVRFSTRQKQRLSQGSSIVAVEVNGVMCAKRRVRVR